MRNIFLFVILFIGDYGFSQTVGYIFIDSVVLKVPEIQSMWELSSSQEKKWESELKADRESLQSKLEKLGTDYKVSQDESIPEVKKRMLPSDTVLLNIYLKDQNSIDDRYKVLTSKVEERRKANQQKQDLVIRAASKIVAERRKYSFVVDALGLSGVLMFSDRKYNITNEVIEEVRKMVPLYFK